MTATIPRLRIVFINILVLAGFLVLVEGLAGYGLFAGRLALLPQLAERRHTKYDPLLGWVNIPATAIPDMYGPGISLTINHQGFRNERDFTPKVEPGRTRVVCSGDSFTLGYGVGDEQTWCQLLTHIDPRLETVNMGQGGYGVDQAYLWYKRDGIALEHQMHVFAFIDEDFGRMGGAEFSGYPKPVLKIVNGELVAEGVPVPGPRTGFVHRAMEYANQLNTSRLARAIARSLGTSRPPLRHDSISETRAIVVKILDDLQRLNAARTSRLVLLMLPIPEELEAGVETSWESFIRQQAAARQITFVDTFPAFRSLSPEEQADMFFQKGTMEYPGAEGHLTPRGNELTARLIYDALRDSLPSQ